MTEQGQGRLRRALSRWTSSTQQLDAEELHESSRERGCTAIADLVPRSRARVSGTLRSVTLRPRAGVPALVAELYDGTGVLSVVWLGRRKIPGIAPGRLLVATGRVLVEEGQPSMFNPRYQLLPAGVGMTADGQTVDTVEALVRAQLGKALGGGRGMAEAAVPTLVFTLAWLLSGNLRVSLALAAAVAVLLVGIRLLSRQTVQFVLNSLVGVGLAAAFALRSGRAEDAFLPGILYNGAYAVLLFGSVLLRWPLVGFMVGAVTGDPTGWRSSPAVVRLTARLTLLLALPCVLRVLVQYPLYAAGEVGWLGVAKIGLGWPLQIAALAAMVWLLARGRTPVHS